MSKVWKKIYIIKKKREKEAREYVATTWLESKQRMHAHDTHILTSREEEEEERGTQIWIWKAKNRQILQCPKPIDGAMQSHTFCRQRNDIIDLTLNLQHFTDVVEHIPISRNKILDNQQEIKIFYNIQNRLDGSKQNGHPSSMSSTQVLDRQK